MSAIEHDPDCLQTYSYDLPDELIAREPSERRDGARLMVLDRQQKTIQHRTIRDLPDLLKAGDRLVLNNTRVVPARIAGQRTSTGGRWEGLFLRRLPSGEWEITGQTRGRLQPGETITLQSIHHPEDQPDLKLHLRQQLPEGTWLVRPDSEADAFTLLDRFGTVPLPPYIRRKVAADSDWTRYQTTYAQTPGSVAAPTAGLHFTEELLGECDAAGIGRSYVTLHVGIGTFRPVSAERLSEHSMHSEWCVLPQSTADEVRQTRSAGGRVIAVGTTTVRTLESVAARGELTGWQGETSLFIRPPHEFRAIDGLLTNFHLPRSTLLVLVCALAGTGFVQRAYQEAVRERYRFFSYGDAMLIL